MPQFLALVSRDYERFTEADFTPLLDAEAEYVRTMYASGTIRQVFGRRDVPGAVIVLEAGDAQTARDAVHSLPLLERHMLRLDAFLEIGPYRGFGPRAAP